MGSPPERKGEVSKKRKFLVTFRVGIASRPKQAWRTERRVTRNAVPRPDFCSPPCTSTRRGVLNRSCRRAPTPPPSPAHLIPVAPAPPAAIPRCSHSLTPAPAPLPRRLPPRPRYASAGGAGPSGDMGPALTKDDYEDRSDSFPSSPSSSFAHSHYHNSRINQPPPHDIPHEKRLAKRQIEVYYRDFFMLYHDRTHEMARIDSAARAGHIDEEMRQKLRKEQFLRELEYIRKRRNPMSMAHYEIIRKIGQGSFGEVFLVRHRGDRRLYAMKKLQKKDMIYKRQVNHVWLERFVLASVGEHPLVCKMHYSFQDQDHLYFIMEYLHGGDMMTMLIRKEYLPEDWARFYIAELVVAIDALHRTGIIHRDIKPDNILFRKNGHICLSDFGLSKSLMQPTERDWIALTGAAYVNAPNFIEHIRRGDIDLPLADRVKLWKALAKEYAFSQVGTPNYIAPEVLQDNSYSESCDWWSVGVILYEMLVGCPPFCARNPAHVTGMICQWRRYLHFPRELPESRMSKAAKDLICRLLCESQSRLGGRRGLEEFKEHPFFEGIDWDNLAEAKAPFIPDLTSDTDTRYFEDEITKSDISEVIPPQTQTREEALSSATSGSSGSGKDDAVCKSGKMSRRRSSRRIKYDRNRDLEFVGFTFIPMRVERDTNWGSRQDLYNAPSPSRVEQKASSMTEALSLEGDPVESQVKPLRSPRGRVAEAAIAAAEVTSEEREGARPPPWGESSQEESAVDSLDTADGRSLHVRFKETTKAYEGRGSVQERGYKYISDESSPMSSGIRAEDTELLPQALPSASGSGQDESPDYDDLDEGLGAVKVIEVEIRPDDVLPEGDMWEEGDDLVQSSIGRQSDAPPNLHSCMSLPELRSKDSQPIADVEDTPDASEIHRSISRLEPEPSCSDATENDGVERRTSRLNTLVDSSQYREETLSQATATPPQDGVALPPTPSEVDLFVDVASREIHSAARELTNTPNSNVPAVIRHAKEQLSGTAVKIQESLAPTAASTSTASEEMLECPEGSHELHVS